MPEKRVLIVDDEEPIRALLEDTLRAEGYVVDSAGDATQALSLVKEHLYDAAILDFALPDMNGVQLHRELRQMDEELAERTLFISGMAQTADDMNYYSSTAGFLPKPFEVADVLAEIRKICKGR